MVARKNKVNKLKIIDNVALNVLEMFGFKFDIENEFMYKPKYKSDIPLIIIDIKSREISIQGFCDTYHTIENTLYDLYEAKLVERVQ